MKKLKLEVELTYDAKLMHGGDDDKEAKDWFFKRILGGRKIDLILHSNEIGDEIGTIKVLKIKP